MLEFFTFISELKVSTFGGFAVYVIICTILVTITGISYLIGSFKKIDKSSI